VVLPISFLACSASQTGTDTALAHPFEHEAQGLGFSEAAVAIPGKR